MVRLAPNTPEYNRFNHDDQKRVELCVTWLRNRPKDWAEFRKALDPQPKLMTANLSESELIGIDLSNCDLRSAKFQKANLSGANLRGADLRGADFREAYLYEADFTDANLLEARFDAACLDAANLTDTNLLDANLNRASLKKTSLTGAFMFRAKLEGADLDAATGLLPDHSLVRGAHIPLTSDDPWSVLRRKYTGPRVVLNLITIFIALLPFLAKAGFWAAINRAQTFQAASGMGAELGDLSRCFSPTCKEVPLWQVTIGIDSGNYLWVAPLILVAYNAVRLFITYRVAFLRDSEERTGYSPRFYVRHAPPFQAVDKLPNEAAKAVGEVWRRFWLSYAWLYRVDRVLSWFLVVSVAAFAWHVITWSQLSIWLPG